jgi:hypothetical protein
MIFSTYLGGAANDIADALVLDRSGNIHLTGWTNSTNFPRVRPFQSANAGGFDAFLAKMNAQGSGLFYSTYFGGAADDYGMGIALDPSGDVTITGTTSSANFPVRHAFQPVRGGGMDAFVAKWTQSGAGLHYSSFLGGSADEAGESVSVSGSSDFVAGFTNSRNFPTVRPIQKQSGGTFDAFISRISPGQSSDREDDEDDDWDDDDDRKGNKEKDRKDD